MIRIIITCSLFAVAACAPTTSPVVVQPDRDTLIRLEKFTTVEALQFAEDDIKKSKQKELNVYAPGHFDIASQAVSEARNMLRANQPREKVFEKVAVAETVMKNGDLMMRKVKTVLSDEIAIKQHLDSLNTERFHSNEYGNIMLRLEEIIRQVENGQIKEVGDKRAKLKQDMGELQTRAIRQNALHEAEELLKRVTYSGGPQLAPLTYQDANSVFQKADEFIMRNPHMTEAVEKIGKEALFAAKRAMYVTQEVAALSTKTATSLEQVVLDEEYRLARIARALSANDNRDSPLEMQSEKLAKTANDLVAQSNKQEDLVIALRDTLIKVRDSATTNQIVKQLKTEKSEWLAKDALYSAKITQLTNDLKQLEQENVRLKNGTSIAATPSNDKTSKQETKQPVIAHNGSTKEGPTPVTEDLGARVESVLDQSETAVTGNIVGTSMSEQSTRALMSEVIESHVEYTNNANETDASVVENSQLKMSDEPKLPAAEVNGGIAAQIKSLSGND